MCSILKTTFQGEHIKCDKKNHLKTFGTNTTLIEGGYSREIAMTENANKI